tara:strand:+ start:258 stop:485 length:228 start_codon:yes stop_codon:yes gene_type:complete
MTKLNRDGLEIGQPVSFQDMQRIQREHYKKGAVSGKSKVRKSKKPTVSNVPEAKEQEATEKSISAIEAREILSPQ